MEMPFNYLLTFNNIFWLHSILMASLLIGILIEMVILSSQKCYKTKNISNPTGPTMMALPGNSIAIKISAECYEPCLHPSIVFQKIDVLYNQYIMSGTFSWESCFDPHRVFVPIIEEPFIWFSVIVSVGVLIPP